MDKRTCTFICNLSSTSLTRSTSPARSRRPVPSADAMFVWVTVSHLFKSSVFAIFSFYLHLTKIPRNPSGCKRFVLFPLLLLLLTVGSRFRRWFPTGPGRTDSVRLLRTATPHICLYASIPLCHITETRRPSLRQPLIVLQTFGLPHNHATTLFSVFNFNFFLHHILRKPIKSSASPDLSMAQIDRAQVHRNAH